MSAVMRLKKYFVERESRKDKPMRESIKLPAAKSLIIIFLCFLLTSTGWLGWTYHLAARSLQELWT